MSPKDALRELEEAEKRYLRIRGWKSWQNGGILWVDPQEPSRSHIARVAAYKQRQRDANAEDMR